MINRRNYFYAEPSAAGSTAPIRRKRPTLDVEPPPEVEENAGPRPITEATLRQGAGDPSPVERLRSVLTARAFNL
jgi:hypothetical protein